MTQTNNLSSSRNSLLIATAVCAIASCQQDAPTDSKPAARTSEHTVSQASASEEQVVAFCGGCHAMPRPGSFPKSAWYDEVKQGFDFYYQTKPAGLAPPPVQPVVDYFRSRAPESLDVQRAKTVDGPEAVRFRVEQVVIKGGEGSGTRPPPFRSWLIGPKARIRDDSC